MYRKLKIENNAKLFKHACFNDTRGHHFNTQEVNEIFSAELITPNCELKTTIFGTSTREKANSSCSMLSFGIGTKHFH